MSTNPVMTIIIISMIANVCVNSSFSVVLLQLMLTLWLVSILSSVQIIVVRTSTRTNAEKTYCYLHSFSRIRFNTIAFASTISTTIMITVIITTVSISVAVTITLPSFIVLTHIIIDTIVAIFVTLVSI